MLLIGLEKGWWVNKGVGRPRLKGRSWVTLCMGRFAFPCFPGMDNNSKEYFNLKDTYVVLRTLTIKNAKIYNIMGL